jgi:serine/threonine protein kinase
MPELHLPTDVPTNINELKARLAGLDRRALKSAILGHQMEHGFRGKGGKAEAYWEAIPALRADSDLWRDVIECEFQCLVEVLRGEAPTPEEFLKRFPDQAAALLPKLKHYLDLKSGCADSDPAIDDLHPTDADADEFIHRPLPVYLGGFKLLEQLDAGGMGVVFRAFDPRLKREVALKVIKPTLLANEMIRKRFLREAQKTAAVPNDHVVTIYQWGQVRRFPFLVMELLKGAPLRDRLRGRMPWREAVAIGLEIAKGLKALHSCGIIHRDLKPSNIWLQRHGNEKAPHAKILDFGIARALEDSRITIVQGPLTARVTIPFLGTPAYASPEQAKGEDCDQRSDLFSLGTVLYQMVTGDLPFQGTNKEDILEKVRTHHQRPAIDLVAELPDDLSQLIQRLLAKDAHERPASAKEVILALSLLLKPRVTNGGADADLDRIRRAWPTLEKKTRDAILILIT